MCHGASRGCQRVSHESRNDCVPFGTVVCRRSMPKIASSAGLFHGQPCIENRASEIHVPGEPCPMCPMRCQARQPHLYSQCSAAQKPHLQRQSVNSATCNLFLLDCLQIALPLALGKARRGQQDATQGPQMSHWESRGMCNLHKLLRCSFLSRRHFPSTKVCLLRLACSPAGRQINTYYLDESRDQASILLVVRGRQHRLQATHSSRSC